MSESRNNRMRQFTTDKEETDDSEDWPAEPIAAQRGQAPTSMPRNRRGVAVPAASGRSIRLNVKAPPSRLREVTNSRQTLGRSSKRTAIIERSDSDDDEEDGDGDEEEDGVGDDDLEDEDIEGDAEEDEDEEMDDDEEDQRVVVQRAKAAAQPTSRKPAPEQRLQQSNVKAVEDQEMDGGSSDDLSSDPLEEDEEEEGNEDDAEGDEDEDMMDDDENNETINSAAIGEEELDSDDMGDSMDGSRAGTPDPSKLTRRQRGNADSELMALSNEAQKKKFFTAEQLSLRRAEMARRRKDLSEKRTQSEKDETLRRLLHKPAPKRRSRAQVKADLEREEFGGTPAAEGEEPKPRRIFYRTTSSAKGTVIGVPEEWQGTPASRYFDLARKESDEPSANPESQLTRLIEVVSES